MTTTFLSLDESELERLAVAARALLASAAEEPPVDEAGALIVPIEALQRLVDRPDAADRIEIVGFLIGERLRHDLGLHWVVVEDELGRDAALRYRQTEVVFFPRRLLRRQLESAPRVRLELLLHGTREYLANLKRYALGERRPGIRTELHG